MKIKNGILTINITQSNPYGEKQLKTEFEAINGITKLTKSNMKKITIYNNVKDELFKVLNIDKINYQQLPITLKNFKIKKERLIYIHNYAKNNFPKEIFRGDKVFEIDPLLMDAPDIILGAIRINKRANREELVLEFGSFSPSGDFISYKSKSPEHQFNNAIFSCLFHDFVDILINFNTKEIDWKINFSNWNKIHSGTTTIKKYNRRIKG